jgi:FkbM family methyltransferase
MALMNLSLSRLAPQAIMTVRRLLRRAGYDVVRYHHTVHPVARMLRLFEQYHVRQLFDVGANVGQFGAFMRKSGYVGKLISFEPLSDAFAELQRRATGDPDWTVVHMGLGDFSGEAAINIAGNSESSSFLNMLPRHTDVMPSSGYVGTETVPIRTLDEVVEQYTDPNQPLFVKLDTQGFEKKIVQGGRRSLARICGFKLEVSVDPLYEGEALLPEMVEFMSDHGYQLMGVEPGWSNEATGQMLQLEGVFFRPMLTLRGRKEAGWFPGPPTSRTP